MGPDLQLTAIRSAGLLFSGRDPRDPFTTHLRTPEGWVAELDPIIQLCITLYSLYTTNTAYGCCVDPLAIWQWHSNRVCKMGPSLWRAQINPVWGKGGLFGILAHGPAPSLLCHWTLAFLC